MTYQNIVITGTGAYIPEVATPNAHFAEREFYNPDRSLIQSEGAEVISKFQNITGIAERRYTEGKLKSSDIAAIAAQAAIADSGIDPETIDQIILAHNFGDVKEGSVQSDVLPCLASKVKHLLGIKNPRCVAYDILFGCPGWLQGVIQANAFIRSGQAKNVLVIGSETLSRVIDPHDRDSMIYSDGAGATVLELREEDHQRGFLSTGALTYATDEAYYIFWGSGNKPDADPEVGYLKMHGRKIYEFALKEVPAAMKECLEASGYGIEKLHKVFIHQANEKMDEAIIQRFYKLHGQRLAPAGIMPMSIHSLGNSSVATIPTLFHMVRKGKLLEHHIEAGNLVMFASVGAGMHVNAAAYML
jgi:3-oxoacyl-[acyl-carrier-protein] synthase-3